MTSVQRVRRAQQMLAVAALTSAVAWGLAASFGIIAIASVVSWLSPNVKLAPASIGFIALSGGIAVAAALVWKTRHVRSFARVALWIEESVPSLQYSLVTAVEPGRSAFAEGIEAAVEREDIAGAANRALLRTVLPAVAAAVLAAALLYIAPSSSLSRSGIFGRVGSSANGSAGARASRIDKISVDVSPPSYAGERTTTLDDPSSVSALAGSRLVVRGEGSPAGLSATLGSSQIQAHDNRGAWSVSVQMPAKPIALTLHDRAFERILVLDPRSDNAPKIVLRSPLRDTTMRVANLVLHLNASASDDIGLSAGYFEYLITTGSGEVFSAKTVNTPAVHFGGARSGTLNATLDLASLKLNQGDVVSIRAIAQDINTISGPGIATSDTRTFRVARADEYDSVAVDAAAPPPVDSSALSQRMLIMMTEQLVKEQKKISRHDLVRRSGEIGDMENRIKNRVHDILYESEGPPEGAPDPAAGLQAEEGSDDVHAIQNPDLFQAFQALWDAVRSLQIAEPDAALPPMRVALKALDRARLANRLYLRGMPPKVIVDIARVRMSGKEKGFTSTRTPRSAADSTRLDLEKGFSDAMDKLQRSPASAIRDLTMLRVQALSFSPAFAAALGDAVEAFRKKKDATLPLLRARRALAGEPVSHSGLSVWPGY